MQTKIIRFIAVVFVAGLVVAGGCAIWFYSTGAGGGSWTAVYLDTGDLYFGRLSSFPTLSLSDAWYVQHSPQGDVSISDFSKASWKPAGNIQLNRQHIVWTVHIAPDSPLIAAMTAKTPSDALPPALGNLPLASPPQGTAVPSNASSVSPAGY